MALDKEFDVGEILSASDVNSHLLGIWTPLNKFVIASGSPTVSVSFPSISSTFRVFRLTINASVSGDDFPRIRINNDSSATYSYQFQWASSGASTNPWNLSQTSFDLSPDGLFGNVCLSQVIIGKVRSNAAASIIGHTQFSFDYAGVGGIWNNGTDLINRIDVVTSGSQNMYGVYALEGMRGA